MGGFGRNFGLSALKMWAERADSAGRGGWRRLFGPGRRLAAGCRDAYTWIEVVAGGGGFRSMYADFLADAGHREAAGRYRDLAVRWTALADRLLDPQIGVLSDLRAAVRAPGPLALHRGDEILARADDELPGDWAEALYPDLRARLVDLADAEARAAEILARIP